MVINLKTINLLIVFIISLSLNAQTSAISYSFYNLKNKCVYIGELDNKEIKIYSENACPLIGPENRIISLIRFSPAIGEIKQNYFCEIKTKINDGYKGECK